MYGLLKKYHTLCTVLGLDDEAKRAILTSWGVESSRDLTQHQLIDICGKLSAQVDEKQGTARLDLAWGQFRRLPNNVASASRRSERQPPGRP